MTGVPKVAAEDTSIVTGNIRGEKKVIPILKGSDIVIDIPGIHYNRTYLSSPVHILIMKKKYLFQLVTGMTPIHSVLHVFSKIGLVMLLYRSVLVRGSPFSKSFLFFYIIKICRSSCVHWTKVCWIFTPFPNKRILFFYFNRFAETEGIAVLAMLVSQYKITIREEPKFASETFEERKSRVLSTRLGLTLTYVFCNNHV